MYDDTSIADIDPPESRRCVVCGERACFGFGPPGNPALDANAWYCSAYREEGERAWTARYRPTGVFGDSLL
jgi:hypothetical protein